MHSCYCRTSAVNGSGFECEGQISPLMFAADIAIGMTTCTQRKCLQINVVYVSSPKGKFIIHTFKASDIFAAWT